jgi:chemotaxis protein MotB
MKMVKSLLLCLAMPAALLTGCVSLDDHNRVLEHLKTEQEANTALTAELERRDESNRRLDTDNKNLRKKLGEAQAVEAPKVDEEELYRKLREAWEKEAKGEWEYIRNGGAVGVRIDDRGVLFKSGSWDLTDKTKETLKRLCVELKKRMDAMTFVRVDGHTDGDPVKKAKGAGIQDNIHLSMMRAMAVRNFLVAEGVPADRVFCAGFGELWPIDTNATSKGKQRNRRVEVFLGTADALSIGDVPAAVEKPKNGEKVEKSR